MQVINLGNSLPGAVGAIIDCFPYVIRFTLKIPALFSLEDEVQGLFLVTVSRQNSDSTIAFLYRLIIDNELTRITESGLLRVPHTRRM